MNKNTARLHRMTHLIIVLSLTIPAILQAQEPWPISLEIYIGPTRGFSDDDNSYRGSRTGVLADLLIGTRIHPADQAGAFVALGIGGHGINLQQTDDCILRPSGGCVPWFPAIGGLSALTGWESRSTRFRLLAGPSIVSSDSKAALGVSARVDGALPLPSHITGAVTLSTLLVPSWDGDRFFYCGFGIGLRIR